MMARLHAESVAALSKRQGQREPGAAIGTITAIGKAIGMLSSRGGPDNVTC